MQHRKRQFLKSLTGKSPCPVVVLTSPTPAHIFPPPSVPLHFLTMIFIVSIQKWMLVSLGKLAVTNILTTERKSGVGKWGQWGLKFNSDALPEGFINGCSLCLQFPKQCQYPRWSWVVWGWHGRNTLQCSPRKVKPRRKMEEWTGSYPKPVSLAFLKSVHVTNQTGLIC